MFKLYSSLASTSPAHAHLADQLFRSITSIGAHIEEGQAPGSRKDMAFKYAVALRESREANYWSRLGATDPRWADRLESITRETGEFIAMLTVSVRKLRAPEERGRRGRLKVTGQRSQVTNPNLLSSALRLTCDL